MMLAMQITGEELSIRPVTELDADHWISLVNALADYEKLDRPTPDAVDRLKAHALADVPKFTAWLVWLNDKPIGYCVFFETYSTFLAKPTLYLEDLFVHPDYRGAGVGRHVWNALEDEVLLRDCGRMEWTCLHWNMLGINFYEKRGACNLTDEWRTYRLVADQIRERQAAGA
jgi:GNAT superfamily N-acetyltransferase